MVNAVTRYLHCSTILPGVQACRWCYNNFRVMADTKQRNASPVNSTQEASVKHVATDEATVLRHQLQELRQQYKSLQAVERERRRALEEAQTLTHLGSWEWDVATGHIHWSDELYRIYGLKPQEREIGFKEFMEMIHVEDRKRVNEVIQAAYQSGKPFEFEHRIVLPNGRLRSLLGIGKVAKDKDGQPVRMIGTSQDITARKSAETALRQSDERFRAVTNATHDLVYDLDLAMQTMWFNDALESEYGYPAKAEHDLKWWKSCIHPDDALRVEEELASLLISGQQTWHAEYRFRKADGSYAVIRNRAYMLLGSDGSPERIVGSCLDITQQKQLDRAKDEFISLVSHQLRTPLTIIRLYGNMLTDGIAGPLTKKQLAYVNKVTFASIRLIKLVGDILNISRIELNRIKIDSVPTDANELVQQCIDELAPIIKTKRADVQFTADEKVGLAAVDATIFCEIAHNLIGNALRYGNPDSGKVEVSFSKDKRGYLLTVKDNGLGIPKADQSHIFERFYRAQNAASVDSEGSGLGLYMVKLFTEAAGGQVWFDSVEGQGTTFHVLFPPDGMKPRLAKV
jgi:PAS domain S-box-containing protein